MRANRLPHKNPERGVYLWTVVAILFIGAVLAVSQLFITTQKVKTSSEYALCQRALNNADAGVDRFFYSLINTPDTNNDGIYDDDPPNISDTWGTKIYDIDNNGITDFYQLFGLNKNVPDIANVAESNAIELFISSDDEAWVWIEANTPSPNMATIHSYSEAGGCTKKVKTIVAAVAGSPGSGITSPVFNAAP